MKDVTQITKLFKLGNSGLVAIRADYLIKMPDEISDYIGFAEAFLAPQGKVGKAFITCTQSV